MATISILVPVYNVEKYLERCIDSILKQSFQDFDLLLVNDGSTDKSGEICDKYKKLDNRVHIIHKKNEGVAEARNICIKWALKNSDSEWITFIDSDDWVHRDYLKLLYNAAQEGNTEISCCNYIRTGDGKNIPTIGIVQSMSAITPENLCVKNGMSLGVVWGKLYKKFLWNDIVFPYGKIHEDEFVIFKVLYNVNLITYVDEQLYYYFYNADSITSDTYTVKHLVLLDALEQGIKFFDDNNYEKALLQKLRYYFVVLNNFHKAFSKQATKYSKQLLLIRKKMRRSLRKYGKKYGINFQNYSWYYEIAYPKSINLYWIVKSKIRSKNK